MPRSPSDATRFTATGPYASTKSASTLPSTSSTTGSRINFGEAPANESPQQKIARLRAAAAQTRRSKEDRFDKVVRVGRVWADRAHRVTAYSLLGLTIVSIVVATAGITDLVLHNRARRRDWYKEQELKRKAELEQASRALSAGIATQDQRLLLAQERVKQDALEAKKNKPGMFKSASSYLFGGLAKEEQKDGKLGAAATAAASKTAHTLSAAKDAVAEQLNSNAAESMMNIPAQDGERASIVLSGGMLDQQAQHLVNSAVEEGRTWRRWLTKS